MHPGNPSAIEQTLYAFLDSPAIQAFIQEVDAKFDTRFGEGAAKRAKTSSWVSEEATIYRNIYRQHAHHVFTKASQRLTEALVDPDIYPEITTIR